MRILTAVALAGVGLWLMPAALEAATLPPVWESDFGSMIVAGDDDVSGEINLGINFPFFGTSHSTVEASTNGFLSFGSSNGAGCCNGNVEDFLKNSPRIAPAWMDWVTAVYQNVFADHVTFTWDGSECCSPTNPGTFQVRLYSDGRIVFAYANAGLVAHSALIGVTPGADATDPGPSSFAANFTSPNSTIYEITSDLSFLQEGNRFLTPQGSGWQVTGAIPEPATLGLALGGVALLLIGAKRTRT